MFDARSVRVRVRLAPIDRHRHAEFRMSIPSIQIFSAAHHSPLTVLRTALLLAATTHTPMAMVRRMARHRLLRTRRIQTATVPLLHRLAGATVVVRAKAAMVAVRKVATAVVATVVVVRVATVVATVVVKVALVVAVVAKGSARTCRNSSGTRALCKW